jgi:wyosine [tRNA(Phe)-imidazoG37] synthetase (radical SAM superfamily)
VNRPAPGVSIDRIIDGLQRFSRSFTGQLWIELFILPGINDSEDHLTAVKRVMQDIGPTLIQLNRLARPPAYSWVQRADDATMQRIADTLAPLPVVIL